jgi:hypothetical protein
VRGAIKLASPYSNATEVTEAILSNAGRTSAPTPVEFADYSSSLTNKYFAQIVYKVVMVSVALAGHAADFQTVGIAPSTAAQDIYANVTATDPTLANIGATGQQALKLFGISYIDLYSGTLWLYPVAGGVLVLCALRSLIRYHFDGRAQWFIHGTQILGGIGLALVGLLAKEEKIATEEDRLEMADAMVLGLANNTANHSFYSGFVFTGWSVLVVFAFYLVVTILTSVSTSHETSLTSRV